MNRRYAILPHVSRLTSDYFSRLDIHTLSILREMLHDLASRIYSVDIPPIPEELGLFRRIHELRETWEPYTDARLLPVCSAALAALIQMCLADYVEMRGLQLEACWV